MKSPLYFAPGWEWRWREYEPGKFHWTVVREVPAPKGEFSLYIRAYWPKAEILNDRWKPPAVLRMSQPGHHGAVGAPSSDRSGRKAKRFRDMSKRGLFGITDFHAAKPEKTSFGQGLSNAWLICWSQPLKAAASAGDFALTIATACLRTSRGFGHNFGGPLAGQLRPQPIAHGRVPWHWDRVRRPRPSARWPCSL
jgi:hypothetical protein